MANLGRLGPARWVLVALLAGGGLAACGDDAPKTTSAANGQPATAPVEQSSTTQPTVAPCTFSGATDPAKGGGDAPTRLLTDVRVGVHECYERVTFELKPQRGEADGPVGWKAAYEPGPITEDGSGRTVTVKGAAFLVVTMSAAGADLSQEAAPATYTGPPSLEAAGATRIQQVRRTGDFEGVLTWVIGLDRQRPFRITTQDGPSRVIVDVG
jgi:hypothetical protein